MNPVKLIERLEKAKHEYKNLMQQSAEIESKQKVVSVFNSLSWRFILFETFMLYGCCLVNPLIPDAQLRHRKNFQFFYCAHL